MIPRWLRRKPMPWKTLCTLAVIAFVLLLLVTLDPLRNKGLMISEETPASAKTPRSDRRYLDINIMYIRNEVYVLNQEELTFDQLRTVLEQLKTERPQATIELRLQNDVKQGMVSELEQVAARVRLPLQKVEER
jgi:biopolymer transport protein ExbD